MLPWVPQSPRNEGEETTPGGDTCKIWGEQRFDDCWKGGLMDSLWAGGVGGGRRGRKSGCLRENASQLRITSVHSEPSLWQGSAMHREPGLFFLAAEGTGGGGAGKGKLRCHVQWTRGLRRSTLPSPLSWCCRLTSLLQASLRTSAGPLRLGF